MEFKFGAPQPVEQKIFKTEAKYPIHLVTKEQSLYIDLDEGTAEEKLKQANKIRSAVSMYSRRQGVNIRTARVDDTIQVYYSDESREVSNEKQRFVGTESKEPPEPKHVPPPDEPKPTPKAAPKQDPKPVQVIPPPPAEPDVIDPGFEEWLDSREPNQTYTFSDQYSLSIYDKLVKWCSMYSKEQDVSVEISRTDLVISVTVHDE